MDKRLIMRATPLSHRLLWLLLAATIVGFLLLLAPLIRERTIERDQAGLTAMNIHAKLAGEINQQLLVTDRLLTMVQDELTDGTAMPDALRRQVEMAARLMPAAFSMVTLLDSEGAVTYDSSDSTEVGGNRGWRPFFQEHRGNGDMGLHISGPYAAIRDGEPILVLSRRLSDLHGRFTGVIYTTMNLSYFGKLFTGLTLREGTSVTLFLDPGIILARRPYDPQFIGRNLSTAPALVRAIQGKEQLFEERAQIDGVTRLYFSERLADYPLRINVAQPIDMIQRLWWMKFSTILVLFTALTAGLTTSLLLLRQEHRQANFLRMMLRRRRPSRRPPSPPPLPVDNVYPLIMPPRIRRADGAEK